MHYMDTSLILQIIVLLGAIFLGVRLGGMAIGYTGGLGVAVLALGLGLAPGHIPHDVILIIMAVIAAIAALQLAGGLDYLVRMAENILRRNPKNINFLAPTVTYFLTILAGTGHTAYSMMPVIVEVAKSENIKPSAPLSIAVVASQIAITASPVSAAVVFMSGILEPLGVSYPRLLLIWLATTYAACMLVALLINLFFKLDLSQDPVYRQRLAAGLVLPPERGARAALPKGARLSVWIFLLGVAWLGDTFVNAHLDAVKETAAALVSNYPWLLAVALFFASMLLYSQAATAKAIMPAVVLALGITPANNGQVYILVASFAAVSALLVAHLAEWFGTNAAPYWFAVGYSVIAVAAIAVVGTQSEPEPAAATERRLEEAALVGAEEM